MRQQNGNIIIVEGYASIFNDPDQQGDMILPGAFQYMLENLQNLPVLWQHYPFSPIGRVISAKEDKHGLWVNIEICTDTQLGKEAVALIQCGILEGLSIGFKAIQAVRETLKKYRIIRVAQLKEISLVTFPSHSKARISSWKEKSVAS